MPDQWRGEWDQEPVGFDYKGGRRWNRGRNNYFAIMLGLVGVFLTIGAIGHFSVPRLLGALCVLASPVAIVGSDHAARRHEDGTRYTPLRAELLWLLGAGVLVVGGATVFLGFS